MQERAFLQSNPDSKRKDEDQMVEKSIPRRLEKLEAKRRFLHNERLLARAKGAI
jgi:hypothetical protein